MTVNTAISSNQVPVRSNSCLDNKLGIVNSKDLSEAVLLLSSYRRQQGIPSGDYSWDHLKEIHYHLHQDIFDDAGEVRTEEVKKTATEFYISPEKINDAMEQIFKELADDNHLMCDSQEQFVTKAAYYYERMADISPFKVGSGIAIRQFLDALANNNGLKLDWKNISKAKWDKALSQGILAGNREPLKSALAQVVTKAEMMSTKSINSAAGKSMEQCIKIVKRGIKQGKGISLSHNVDHEFTDDSGPSMSG